jgi:hypothetical protein
MVFELVGKKGRDCLRFFVVGKLIPLLYHEKKQQREQREKQRIRPSRLRRKAATRVFLIVWGAAELSEPDLGRVEK